MQLYVRSNSVVSRVIAGETLVVPVRKGIGDLASIYSLNATASHIWETIARPSSREAIVRQLADQFDCDATQVEDDVADFLSEMRSAGLVEISGSGVTA